MRIKLDENLSRHLKPRLAALQHDVATVADENLLGEPDARIAAVAKREKRMVLTLDVEFGQDLSRLKCEALTVLSPPPSLPRWGGD